MMKASGEIIHISKTENPDLFPAVVLGLGALGIIVSVTLQCERTFNLHQKQYPAALKDVSCTNYVVYIIHLFVFSLQITLYLFAITDHEAFFIQHTAYLNQDHQTQQSHVNCETLKISQNVMH